MKLVRAQDKMKLELVFDNSKKHELMIFNISMKF